MSRWSNFESSCYIDIYADYKPNSKYLKSAAVYLRPADVNLNSILEIKRKRRCVSYFLEDMNIEKLRDITSKIINFTPIDCKELPKNACIYYYQSRHLRAIKKRFDLFVMIRNVLREK